jgi:RNA-directed DNA polymerase
MDVRQLFEKIEAVEGVPEFTHYVQIRPAAEEGKKKTRVIYAPNDAMREVHGWIRQWLRGQPKFPHYLPKSALASIAPHRKNTFFYQTDIYNAYGSVTIENMLAALSKLTWLCHTREDRAIFRTILETYCMAREGGLATGGPASQDLFNVCAAMWFDKKFWRYGLRNGVKYTRYIDDLTFSSQDVIGKKQRRWIRIVLGCAGFTVNHRKSTIRRRLWKNPVTITGLRLESGGRIFVPRAALRRLRGLLHMFLRGAPIEWESLGSMMSVFWSPYGGKISNPPLNATERKVLALFEQCRLKRLQEKHQT